MPTGLPSDEKRGIALSTGTRGTYTLGSVCDGLVPVPAFITEPERATLLYSLLILLSGGITIEDKLLAYTTPRSAHPYLRLPDLAQQCEPPSSPSSPHSRVLPSV